MSKSNFALRRLALPISLVLMGATGAYAAYTSEPAQLILNDVTAVLSSETAQDPTLTHEATLTTSEPVYRSDGSKIGSIRAIIRDGDAPQTVYVGGEAYPAGELTVQGPRLVLGGDILQSASLETSNKRF